MNPTRFVRRMFAGAAGSLLLVGAVVLDSVVYGASAPQGSPVTGQLEEPFFIEIDQAHRRSASFVGDYGSLRSTLASRGIRVEELWVGDAHLYLRVSLPPGTAAERDALIEGLKEHALVGKVIAAASGGRELLGVDRLQKVAAAADVPEARLRGLREKRRDFKPDLRAANTGEIIVKYLEAESYTPARLAVARTRVALLHAQVGARSVRSLGVGDAPAAELVALPPGADMAAALRVYMDSEDVEYAQPNYVYTADAIPNDPSYASLWGMPKISAPSAWDTRTDASSVIVAVTDTGIDYNHGDLAVNMWQNPSVGALGAYDGLRGADFVNNDADPMDDVNHGTHVSGTIGAVGNNGVGVVGVSWRVKLMAVKVLGPNGGGSAQLASGLDYARLKGANIVNASLGWNPPGSRPPDTYVDQALERLRNAGVAYVNSAGNYGQNNDVTPQFPANIGFPNMVVVGASDQNDQRSVWPSGNSSHWGRWSVDVFAPGSSINSTVPGNQYASFNGTSMAAPHVTGMLALAKAQFPWEGATELADRARFSVDAVGALSTLSMSGGRINAASALGGRPYMINGSGRCFVKTGSEIAIGGIWIGGPNSKRVGLRAWGPSLAQFGISPALPDPQITIYNSSGQPVGSNNNWGSLSQADRNELAAHGLTPLHALDSAWVGTLAPGGYTIHFSGAGGSTGIGLLECWDFDGATATRLTNTSTRCYVGTGNSIAIGGFTVSGSKPRQVYIRALGPTLGTWGIPNALQDTVIALYDSGGNQLASNDDWRSFDGSSTALENRLSKTWTPPYDNRESVIVMRLSAGAYTVHLSGKNGTTGVGLVEINEY